MHVRRLLLLLVTTLALALLYVVLRPAASTALEPHYPLDAASATPQVYRLRVGERASLDIRSAEDGEVMVHGLTMAGAPVAPDRVAVLGLEGVAAGRYPIHFHGGDGRHVPIGEVVVEP